ncbi:DNA primase [Streptomyces sp. NPDC016845]|uniref:DNA primase n=1 Tax=Streptomyces sp. NPDC016845 TaxID=3364972 RepID=UPI0037B21039
MNRAVLGLAVGAGYILGRTKKMKLAFAVGTMVAGKRLKLSPSALAELVTTQLDKNPQFKELSGQLRQDLRGVGTAATGALVERQINGLAGRLHSRTQGVQDRIAGVAPDTDDVRDAGERVTGGLVPKRRREEQEQQQGQGQEQEQEQGGNEERNGDAPREEKSSSNGRARKSPRAASTAKQAPARKSTAAGSASAGRTAAKKTTAARKTATRTAKGGGGRG